jgi:hypothetical protein
MERFPDQTSRLDLAVGTSVEVRVSGERAMELFPDHSPRQVLAPGTSVEVRGHFRGEFSGGFEVAETTDDGYWVRRLSDHYLLPVEFLGSDVRRVS